MKFGLWLENREVSDAILGAISPAADDAERDDILAKSTTYFGSSVRRRLKGLGVVRDAKNYGDIVRGIDDGMKVSELIKRVAG